MTDPANPIPAEPTPAGGTPAGATPPDLAPAAAVPDPAAAPVAGIVGKPPRPVRRALFPAIVLLVIVVGGLVAIGFGSKSHARLPGNVGETPAGGTFAGGTLVPAKAAPATTLRNYLGQTVSLADYRGKVVFVTFLYTRCPDVCPLIATNLHATQAALGGANDKVQMIAISVDPKGDTPQAVANFLRVHNLVGRMQYLVGSATDLGRVWAAWNVGSARDAASPALVDHSALVYGISAQGALTTIYPAQFKPSDLVHDTPLLLGR
jgi:protein SCO1/2